MATLEAAQTPERDGGGVLRRFGWRFVLWRLAGRLKHDLVGKLIRVAGALL